MSNWVYKRVRYAYQIGHMLVSNDVTLRTPPLAGCPSKDVPIPWIKEEVKGRAEEKPQLRACWPQDATRAAPRKAEEPPGLPEGSAALKAYAAAMVCGRVMIDAGPRSATKSAS